MSDNIFGDDYEVAGQLDFEDVWGNHDEQKGALFAVSKILARARKQMSLGELKAFVHVLTNVTFKGQNPDRIKLDKKALAEIVGVNSDADHLSENLKRSIGDLPKHSYVEFADKDKDFYANGFLITDIIMYKNVVSFGFNPTYKPLFENLSANYIVMWSGDIYGMKSERSVIFYEYLRTLQRYDWGDECTIGVKEFKRLFDIPKDGKGSYLTKKGSFDRPAFEKRVIMPLCEDLSRCRMIRLCRFEDGLFYKKVKCGNRVRGYYFKWEYTAHPRIGNAHEMAEVQRKIEKNPKTLKIAKDLANGRKSNKGLNNFELNNSIDVDALEKALLAKNDRED